MVDDPAFRRAGSIDKGAATMPARELSADAYRVLAVVLVVIGHWLAASVSYSADGFGNDNPLLGVPWTQWLTWIFQVVPVFFLVGGYASAASWSRWRDAGGRSGAEWVRRRLGAVLGPTSAYVVVVLVVVAVLAWARVNGAQLAFATWAVAMHLWFIPVYLIVLSLTPAAVAAHRRWGLWAPVALAIAVAAVDAVTLFGHVHLLGWVNYGLCWAAIYQLGIAWYSGALRGRRAVLLAVIAAVALILLVGPGPYPISMIGVAGAHIQNTSPPTVALLSFAAVQAGLLVAAAPVLTRRLRRSRWRQALAAANKNVMALYLWHMIPVIVVALIGYPSGLLPQPEPGTGAWWLFRAAWVLILSVVTAAEMALLWLGRAVFRRALPTWTVPLPGWCAPPLPVAGVAIAVVPLWRFAVDGFAPDGRFPVLGALLFAAGVGLLSIVPRAVKPSSDGI
jgi:fucose 4-O-acetylase-like acetyltransferase